MNPLGLRFTPPRIWPNIDWLLLILAVALSLCGVVTIWGASSTEGKLGAFVGYANSQFQWLLLGLTVAVPLVVADYRWTRRMAWPMYLTLVAILILVLLRGQRVNGSMSWFAFHLGGRKIQFQPSEPAKVIVVIMLADYLAERVAKFRRLRDTILPMGIAGIPIALILKQPDLGTALVFIPTMFVMFFLAGLRKRVLIFYFLLGASGAILAYPRLKEYQKERIQTFLNPGEDALGKGYNVIQAQTAMGSGGTMGKGWGRGTQTNFRFLPEYQTDFVFPTLGEQFGFVGVVAVLVLYALLIGRMTHLAIVTQDLYGVLLIGGLATILVVHLTLNIGMTTGLLPVTGLPLPFFSYGGSFMLTCFVMIGLIVSAGARRET